MQITTVFDTVGEMVNFAKLVIGNLEGGTPEIKPLDTDVPKEQPLSYGQQIAPHFSMENGGQLDSSLQETGEVPTTTPTYKMEDLAAAAMQLMDQGLRDELQQLLSTYGVESLPILPAEQYGNFATALREMGAQI